MILKWLWMRSGSTQASPRGSIWPPSPPERRPSASKGAPRDRPSRKWGPQSRIQQGPRNRKDSIGPGVNGRWPPPLYFRRPWGPPRSPHDALWDLTRRVNLAFPVGSQWFLPILWFPPCSNITPSPVDMAVTRSVFNDYLFIYIYMYMYTRIKHALRGRRASRKYIMWLCSTGSYYGLILWDNITGSYYGIILRDCITGSYYGLISQDYITGEYYGIITGLYHGIILQNYITGLYYGIILRENITGWYYGIISRDYVTGLYYRIILWINIMGQYHGIILRDCITGSYYGIISMDYIAELHYRIVLRDYITESYHGMMLHNYITGSY